MDERTETEPNSRPKRLQGPKQEPLTLSVPVKPFPCPRGEGPGPSGVCTASDLTSGGSIWDRSRRSRGNNVLFMLCSQGSLPLALRREIVNSRNFSLALTSHLTYVSDYSEKQVEKSGCYLT